MAWMQNFTGRSEAPVVFQAKILKQTDKAVLINFEDRGVWLPLSLVKVYRLQSGLVQLTVPEWLFLRKCYRNSWRK